MFEKKPPKPSVRADREPADMELKDDDLEQVVGGLERHLPGWGAEDQQVPDRSRDESLNPTSLLP